MLQANEGVDESDQYEKKRFVVQRIAGQGTFGTVQLGRDTATGEQVAIKRVIQDPRFRNRELQIMKDLAEMNHPNIVKLISYYYTTDSSNKTDIYLNVVMDFVPDTLHRWCRSYHRRYMKPPAIMIKLFLFQLLRSIACLHLPKVNICHRDLKPHNVLVNVSTGLLKLCDFGSAKKLSASEANVSYICSRYYRAPELIFGNQHYTTAVDVWSVGCIFAEMILGEPLFRGSDNDGQLREIVNIMGPPSAKELTELVNKGTKVEISESHNTTLLEVFKDSQPAIVHHLIAKLLCYSPTKRITAMNALCHPYFDELRKGPVTMPNGKEVSPELLTFLPSEIESMSDSQKAKLTAL